MNKYEQLSHTRKQLQNGGQAPDWYTTAAYQLLVNQEYLDRGETPKDMYSRIALRASELTKFTIPENYGYSDWNTAFFDIMWKGWLSPSTPVLTNMGNSRGHPIACSGTHIDDSIRSFYEARMEIAQLTQRGYGTSWGLDLIRHRGSPVSKGGTANGIMQPAAGAVKDMQDVSQGSRRGNIGQYLNPLHADFDELINQLRADHDGWNIGWNFTSEFNELIKRDPDRADYIWKRILSTKMITGKGYMLFLDKVNATVPKMYKDRGFKVRHSNLCVTGDTKILTKDGYKEIASIAGQLHTVWNGKEWSENVEIVKTSNKQKVLTVTLDNYTQIKATPYHKWFIQENYGSTGIVMKRTSELKPGDKIVKHDLCPVTHGTQELTYAYENGFFTGDGTVVTDTLDRIYLYDNKKLLLSRFANPDNYREREDRFEVEYKSKLKHKFFIPDSNYSVKSRLTWLAGFVDADGTLTNNNGTESIQVSSINLDFLKDLSLFLQELGVHSTISKMHDAAYRLLPANDNTGELKEFWCSTSYRLLIAGSQLNHLLSLGFSPSRVVPTFRTYQREARQFVKVVEIQDEFEELPTYCATEPKRNKLIFNGVLTGNCAEIALMNDKKHSFTCVLSSMNVVKYDEWKDTKAVQIATVFLDAIIEDMLIKAKQEEGFEKIIAFTEKSRALGLGQLGISSYYQLQGWQYGNLESVMFNQQLTKLLVDRSREASELMAKELGEPEWMVGYGRRNSHLLAFPPTKSTAIIMGGFSEGINPVYANVYEQETAGGIIYRINPVLLPIMKTRGQYTKDVMKRISEAQGSVQGESWLTPEEKLVFRTAFEINQETILLKGSHRQRIMNSGPDSIGQGQSLNLYITAEETEEEISRLHKLALEDEHLQSLYYVHSLNESSTYKVDKSTCASCEG